VVGRRCHEVRADSTRALAGAGATPCAGCPVSEARRQGAAAVGEVRSVDGRTYMLRAFPLVDQQARMTVCHYHDVTDERTMTRELASAERLAAIGRLAGGVAHEINNPLGGILAFAQILQREEVTPVERKEYLAEIERSALRCKAIVEALLRFSRQAPRLDRRRVSVNDVVRDAARTLGARDPHMASVLHLELGDGLPAVLGDSIQLQQVVANLVSNALDSDAGRADIRVATAPATDGGSVKLQVVDRGGGIDDEHLARLFDPFFTTKEEGKGAGLGLAVAYAIVQDHGGKIVARNRTGGGAEFTVTLPAAGEGNKPDE
jgi:two-component system NtrC family sensor kinase